MIDLIIEGIIPTNRRINPVIKNISWKISKIEGVIVPTRMNEIPEWIIVLEFNLKKYAIPFFTSKFFANLYAEEKIAIKYIKIMGFIHTPEIDNREKDKTDWADNPKIIINIITLCSKFSQIEQKISVTAKPNAKIKFIII